jgi:hypothetical protein
VEGRRIALVSKGLMSVLLSFFREPSPQAGAGCRESVLTGYCHFGAGGKQAVVPTIQYVDFFLNCCVVNLTSNSIPLLSPFLIRPCG